MRQMVRSVIVLGLLLVGRTASAAEIYNEASGDLSGDRLAPTPLTVGLGSNTVTATSISGDREHFRFSVPAGRRLSAIIHVSNTGVRSFIAVQPGNAMTVDPVTFANEADLTGYLHFGSGTGTVGTNILDDMGLTTGDFSGPLPAGDYTFWTQETGGSPSTYTLDFQVTQVAPITPASAVPIPPVFAGLLALGLSGVGLFQLRHRSSRTLPRC